MTTPTRRGFFARLGALFLAPKIASVLPDTDPGIPMPDGAAVPVSSHAKDHAPLLHFGQSQHHAESWFDYQVSLPCDSELFHRSGDVLGLMVEWDDERQLAVLASGEHQEIGRLVAVRANTRDRHGTLMDFEADVAVGRRADPPGGLCPYTFRSELCGYNGPRLHCDKTFADCACKQHFGGIAAGRFPGSRW